MKAKNLADYSHVIYRVASGIVFSRDDSYVFKVQKFRARKTKTRYELLDGKQVAFNKLMQLDTDTNDLRPSYFTWCDQENQINAGLEMIKTGLIEKCEKLKERFSMMASYAAAATLENISIRDMDEDVDFL